MINIVLASKSKVRKEILNRNNISCVVEPSNVDEDLFKESLLNEGATPEIISGVAPSFKRLSLTKSSSTFDGSTIQEILFLFNISFLTLLFEAKIKLYISFIFYFINFYY